MMFCLVLQVGDGGGAGWATVALAALGLAPFDLTRARFITAVACGERPASIAVCMALRTIVVNSSKDNTLHLFTVEPDGAIAPAGTLGAPGSGPLQFKFVGKVIKMAFTVPAPSSGPGAARPTLLVADCGNDRVQEVDVVARAHVGYLCPPGTLKEPFGVATSRTHIAVTTCTAVHGLAHLFDAVSRARLWTVGGLSGSGSRQLSGPFGVRFTADGARVAVADRDNKRIAVLSVDGSLVGHVLTPGIEPCDVEEVQGGWLVATGFEGSSVALVPAVGGEPVALVRGVEGSRKGQLNGVFSFALVPGLGLLVPDRFNDRFQVFRS
jgi:DNA-binding beta-propeller fold protein YncE